MSIAEINKALLAAAVAEAEEHTGLAEAFLKMVETMQETMPPRPKFEVEKTIPPFGMRH